MLFSVVVANAQEHLKFKGVEMTGSVHAFVKELQKKGCERSPSGDFDDYLALKGTIANYGGFTILVKADLSEVKAYQSFPTIGNAKVSYDNLLSVFESKYIVAKVEEVPGYLSAGERVSSLMYAPGGSISICVIRSGFEYLVYLFYTDYANQPKREDDI